MPAQGGYNVSPDKREFFHSIRDMSGEEMKETKKDYAIFVDSSADLAPSLLQDGKLQMVAMSYTNGAANCELAGVASDSAMKEFYDGQRRGNLTRTSQVSPQQFIDAFTPALQSGRKILYISHFPAG